MKLLFDQHLSPKLVGLLADLFPDSRHVQDERLDVASDEEIWEFAKLNDFAILTKDADYNNLSILRGTPPKVLWLLLGNCKTSEVVATLRDHASEIQEFGLDPTAGTLILGNHLPTN